MPSEPRTIRGPCYGYGDYIIMDVSGDGQIAKYERPTLKRSEWVRLS